jgi:hypothetical protein
LGRGTVEKLNFGLDFLPKPVYTLSKVYTGFGKKEKTWRKDKKETMISPEKTLKLF